MTDQDSHLSRRTFLKAGSALLLVTAAGLPEAAADESGTVHLHNVLLQAEFDGRGLTALHDQALNKTINFGGDSFTVTLNQATLDSSLFPAPTRSQDKNSVTYRYALGPHVVTVTYELQAGWRFVSKQVTLDTTDGADYHVKLLTPFRATLGAPVAGEVLSRSSSDGAFVRFGGQPGYGLFFVVQNPFMQWQRVGRLVSVSYAPEMNWKPNYGPFPVDRACLGPYGLSGQGYPDGDVGRDIAEWRAMTDCLRAFLPAQPRKNVRLHVGAAENDSQIDVATPQGQAEYRRIIDQAAAVGCPNVLYTPANSQLSNPAQSLDTGGQENVFWLGLGQQIRQAKWDPESDRVPPTLKTMQEYAAKRGVQYVAAVDPSLPWRTSWNAGTGRQAGANSADREFQDWLVGKLVDFQQKTGVSGYSFNDWRLGYSESSPYAQWYGCRWILEALRGRLTELLMDGGLPLEALGPWTWLALTFPSVIDRPPESNLLVPDLHIDRLAGNRQRWAAWWFRMDRFCPVEILPGSLTHRAERRADGGLRDWDYLGWKYSVLSSIATAPMNHVLNYLPARDDAESAHFAPEDKKWLRDWLDWTDKNRETLRHVRPITGPPRMGQVDGTAAITEDRGFVFLFNPNQRAMNAEFKLDASIGLAQGQAFTLTTLHPRPGPVGFGHYGDSVALPMEGASALVLEISPARPKLPLLLYTTGSTSLHGQTLAVTNVSGPIGQDVDLPIVVPPGKSVTAVTVNGGAVPFTRDGDTVTAHARFAGTRFGAFHNVGPYPTFQGGEWQGQFTIPARVFDQLRRRKTAWPIPYTTDDLKATWLGPDRLLLYIQLADPNENTDVRLTLDDQPTELKKAYTSIYPQATDRTFVGWYQDVSALAPDTPHTFTLTLPPLAPGQFQGVFFENVETEYTQEVAVQATILMH